FYPIGVAEKGFVDYRFTVHGTWGHGSMPRSDNAAVLAARIVERIADPGPVRLTPAMERFFAAIRESAPSMGRAIDALIGPDPRPSAAVVDALCDPTYARIANALLRDTISPNVIRAGLKHNIIPGEAVIEIDARMLPGTDEPAMRQILRERIGEELWARIDVEIVVMGDAVEAPVDSELYRIMAATLRDHDPDAVPVPIMAPFATDAKYTGTRLGVPTYGFSPLRLAPEDRFLDLFHGIDERVSLDALRFGLPVLYDVVRRFCG
ncbi:MAG: M20/M25/M40 family metallo-hydrolase, partial [Chloroflexota bacterium]|nr:M20/M25/M40 family metallo-hydrolase [Chloroflexota bacterium]